MSTCCISSCQNPAVYRSSRVISDRGEFKQIEEFHCEEHAPLWARHLETGEFPPLNWRASVTSSEEVTEV